MQSVNNLHAFTGRVETSASVWTVIIINLTHQICLNSEVPNDPNVF